MIFYIQKTLLLLLLPPSSLLIIMLTGFILTKTRYKRTGKTFILCGFAVLYLLSTPVVSNTLIKPLENDYPPMQANVPRVDAVVVLTGGTKDLSHLGLDPGPSSASLARLMHGIRIYNTLDHVPMIISGGRGNPAKSEISEGRALGKMTLSAGIHKDNLIIEDTSKNTFESSIEVSKILGGEKKKIVLVTSAFHMGRAVDFFAKAGFTVIPAPTDYRGERIKLNIYSFIPFAGSLETSATAVYEYLSRLWYMIIGSFP